jgi:uroporphyrinogen-III synthase
MDRVRQLFEYPPDAIVFTSGSSVDGFFKASAIGSARLLGKPLHFPSGDYH